MVAVLTHCYDTKYIFFIKKNVLIKNYMFYKLQCTVNLKVEYDKKKTFKTLHFPKLNI